MSYISLDTLGLQFLYFYIFWLKEENIGFINPQLLHQQTYELTQ